MFRVFSVLFILLIFFSVVSAEHNGNYSPVCPWKLADGLLVKEKLNNKGFLVCKYLYHNFDDSQLHPFVEVRNWHLKFEHHGFTYVFETVKWFDLRGRTVVKYSYLN